MELRIHVPNCSETVLIKEADKWNKYAENWFSRKNSASDHSLLLLWFSAFTDFAYFWSQKISMA